jgi:hypothetical protein
MQSVNRMTRIAASLWMLSALTACSRDAPAPQQTTQPATPTHQLPTATEVFHLRSECAKMGQQILNDNVVGLALSQSQVSNYNEKTNRCYVELTVQSADMTKPMTVMHRYLFDGQTKELLATTAIEKNVKSGIAYKNAGVAGFEKVNEYINEKMQDAGQ